MFLPECFDYVGENRGQSVSMAAPLDSPRMQGCCELAKELGIWLSLGGYHEKVCITFLFIDNLACLEEYSVLHENN